MEHDTTDRTFGTVYRGEESHVVSVIRALYQSSESGLKAVTLWLKCHCEGRVEQARSGLRFRWGFFVVFFKTALIFTVLKRFIFSHAVVI